MEKQYVFNHLSSSYSLLVYNNPACHKIILQLTHIRMNSHMDRRTHINIHMQVHTLVCMQLCMYTCNQVHARIHTAVHTHIHTYLCVHKEECFLRGARLKKGFSSYVRKNTLLLKLDSPYLGKINIDYHFGEDGALWNSEVFMICETCVQIVKTSIDEV